MSVCFCSVSPVTHYENKIKVFIDVIPAGSERESIFSKEWIPAFAGMTKCTASVPNLILDKSNTEQKQTDTLPGNYRE